MVHSSYFAITNAGISVNTLHPGKLPAILPGVRPGAIIQRDANGTEKATRQCRMCALAVISRAAFAWLPNFKPIYGVIIISGIAFGVQAGFLVGAISAFASNFLFGQGPWTPWQMLAYGICGLIAGGCYFRKNRLPKDPLSLGLFGFSVVLFVVCPLLDTSTVFTTLTVFTPASVISIYTTAIITNIIQAVCTFLTLLALSKPLLSKLERIITKYGLYP